MTKEIEYIETDDIYEVVDGKARKQIISTNENVLNRLSENKVMGCLFCDTLERQSDEYVDLYLKNCSSIGIRNIQFLIHIREDGSIQEDISKIPKYEEIANKYNITISSVKFHGKYTNLNYETNILNLIKKFKNLETVFVFNEQYDSIMGNGLDLPSKIKAILPKVKVGCTMNYGSIFLYHNPKNDGTIQNYYDILGLNIYPSCGNRENIKLTTYEQCIEAFNNLSIRPKWQKDLWITESGVLPFWGFLESPEKYSVDLLADKTRTIAPQKLFYKALLQSNIFNRVSTVIPWYTESWQYEDTLKMWEIFGGFIK